MALPRDNLKKRVMRTLEELLKDRSPDARPVDTDLVLDRMRLTPDDHDELARVMGELVDAGDVRGKQMRGDNKVMDVTVTAITDQGAKLLDE